MALRMWIALGCKPLPSGFISRTAARVGSLSVQALHDEPTLAYKRPFANARLVVT